ncbi:polygalacturonase PglB [Neorhizobium galegae]|uniref:Glycoside hydrolase family 28 n=1 Tax=Neorhizobium galegae bv. orientalis str. HAMBI 540 TaxID=1028800 RepID=A0A068T2B2_NEOGA|nr:glycoside hydrolase family 28 protein [Neorhizobium galegae]CDN52209.1 Glycoside hydrolase family 28 [Neorhizobium galegae bv. orientalis str. HAMBI 540]
MNRLPSLLVEPAQEDETARIQAAIDQVAARGGGCVELAEGIHNTRGLRLQSGVELHLAKGAILRPAAVYGAYEETSVSVIAEKSNRAMIVARNATDIALTGPGRIEAGGEYFIAGNDEAMGTLVPAEYRPRVVVFESCRGVRIERLEIVDSPMWTLHLVNCDDVYVSCVKVSNNRRMPNTDGLVLDACRHVVVEDCDISTADDGICLKTSAGPDGQAIGECENVLVRRCLVESNSCALKIGTESYGDFTNVVFEDCRVHDSNRGLGLFSRDGGHMTDIRFSRIEVDCHETLDGFWGSGEALTVTVVDRIPTRRAGAVRNLVVEDLRGQMDGAIALVSTSAAGIEGVRLSRLRLRQRKGPLGTGLRYDLRPTNADIALSADAAGRANAWTKGADGRVVGLVDYPGGMPALFTAGTEGISIEEAHFERPQPIPEGWNVESVVHKVTEPDGSREWEI